MLKNENKKLGILLDSFSGYSQIEIEKLGYHMIPLQFTIDNKSYVDNGIELSFEEMTNMIQNSSSASTSLPSLALIEEKLQQMSEQYEHTIVLTLSSKLSSTFETVFVNAKKFNNIFPIDNHMCGEEAIWVAKELEKRYAEGAAIENLIEFVEKYNSKTQNYLIPENLDHLIRGGRLKGIKKTILKNLKLFPILKVTEKGITLGGLKRSSENAIKKSIASLLDFIGGESEAHKFDFQIIHGGNYPAILLAEKAFEAKNLKITSIVKSSATVLIHTGIGCISIAVSPKVEFIK
ncbi:DegV family protein [Mycoplasma iguanae]|uniref:DegV family protein n=1 Tax=Mycoplasma iguanae TaxID=292461 RepID=A0ABY5R906_9MOLU|nr:DegV family protein [Mycoplasma iguanae]UVD81766.1 DegV family protein [Mycoplasma iguanae]